MRHLLNGTTVVAGVQVNVSMVKEPSFLSRFSVCLRRGGTAEVITEIASRRQADLPIASHAVVQLRLARRPEYGLALSSRVSQTHHTHVRTPQQHTQATGGSGSESLRISQQVRSPSLCPRVRTVRAAGADMAWWCARCRASTAGAVEQAHLVLAVAARAHVGSAVKPAALLRLGAAQATVAAGACSGRTSQLRRVGRSCG